MGHVDLAQFGCPELQSFDLATALDKRRQEFGDEAREAVKAAERAQFACAQKTHSRAAGQQKSSSKFTRRKVRALRTTNRARNTAKRVPWPRKTVSSTQTPSAGADKEAALRG